MVAPAKNQQVSHLKLEPQPSLGNPQAATKKRPCRSRTTGTLRLLFALVAAT
jgi:hypothetical protein